MRSSALLSLVALGALATAPAVAQSGPPRGGWGPNGWAAEPGDAPLPPGHPPVTAGEPLPADHPPVAAGPMAGHEGMPMHGPDGSMPMHGGEGGMPMYHPGGAGHGPHSGMRMGGGSTYFYVQPNGPQPGYYYVPGQGPQPYGYGHAPGAMVYTNPTGPVMVAPGTTVIVKVAPGTMTKTVTEEWVPARQKRHWRSKARCRCN